MTAIRSAMLVGGMVLGVYGALLLVDNPWAILVNIGIWAAAGVVIHDFVFAPACVAVGHVVRRLIPRKWWTPFAAAGLCSVVLIALAVPVYNRPGARPDNATVLNHDYNHGLWILLLVVWAAVPVQLLVERLRGARIDNYPRAHQR